MKRKLISHFEQYTTLTIEEKEAIEISMDVVEVNEGEHLLHEKLTHPFTYFVLNGCFRKYYLLKGKEKTTRFFTEDQWIIAVENENAPVFPFSIIAVENSLVVKANERKAQHLFEKFPRFERIARQVMEKALFEQQEISAAYQLQTPEERYLNLLTNQPDLIQKVPQYHLASFIGIQPESLSRLRKRIAKKN